jgi:hypothetical protein
MKKNILIIRAVVTLICFFSVFLFLCDSHATVMGDCEVCHTTYPGMKEAESNDIFCVYCHSNADTSNSNSFAGATVPVVYNALEPEKLLAGGNFFYVKSGDRKGHNIDGIVLRDEKFKTYPPGYDRFLDPSASGYDPAKPLTCAGANGCHGDRNTESLFGSLAGSHHAEDTPLDGSTTAKSFRYLRITGNVKGVLGREDAEWQINASSKQHNEYSREINRLCQSCHGYFHRDFRADKKGPWLRHPTDTALPKRGEYLKYNPDVEPPKEMPADYRVYSLEAPLARSSFDKGLADAVRPGHDEVMCLSCHFAHAGPFNSGLRWDYDAVIAGEKGKGACFLCHTEKADSNE